MTQTMTDTITEITGVLVQPDMRILVGRLLTTTVEGETYRKPSNLLLVPGSDVSTLDPKVRAVAGAVWTPDVVQAWQAAAAASAAQRQGAFAAITDGLTDQRDRAAAAGQLGLAAQFDARIAHVKEIEAAGGTPDTV